MRVMLKLRLLCSVFGRQDAGSCVAPGIVASGPDSQREGPSEDGQPNVAVYLSLDSIPQMPDAVAPTPP